MKNIKRRGHLAILLLLSGLATGCSTAPPKTTREQLNQHVIRSEAFYDRYRNTRLEDRIYPAPPEFLDYLTKDNDAQGFPNRPGSPTLTAEVLADIHAAIAELPASIRQIVDQKVAGIFIVKDLGGSAYTDIIYSRDHQPIKGFVVLDITVTDRKANDWLTWKENTPFKPEAGYSLKAEIERGARNTRRYALQFILLHEFAHALSIGGAPLPLWGISPASASDATKYPFFSQSWRALPPVAPDTRWRYGSVFDQQLPDRAKIMYYVPLKTTLLASQMPSLYEQLEHTNFATLYGATNPFDDFAEAFATYVHGVMLKQPYKISISKGDQLLKTFSPCWNEKRCQGKRKALEKFLWQAGPSH